MQLAVTRSLYLHLVSYNIQRQWQSCSWEPVHNGSPRTTKTKLKKDVKRLQDFLLSCVPCNLTACTTGLLLPFLGVTQVLKNLCNVHIGDWCFECNRSSMAWHHGTATSDTCHLIFLFWRMKNKGPNCVLVSASASNVAHHGFEVISELIVFHDLQLASGSTESQFVPGFIKCEIIGVRGVGLASVRLM